MFGPKSLKLPLQPTVGELYAHVFENPHTGIRRNLFWNISAEFEPVKLDNEEWDCSFAVDWLTWPVRTWSELNGMTLEKVIAPEMIEPSLYLLAEHNDATLHSLQLTRLSGSIFEAAIVASAEINTERGKCSVPVSFACALRFAGIVVVRENLEAKPSTPAQAGEAVAQLIQLDGFQPPRSEEWRYVLEPDV